MKLSDISSFINEEVIQTIVESNPSIVCLEPIVSARKYRLPSGREIDVLIETVSGNVYVVELKPSPDPNICKVILYGKELIEQNIFSKCCSEVRCLVCDEVLAMPTGGKSKVAAKILEVLE